MCVYGRSLQSFDVVTSSTHGPCHDRPEGCYYVAVLASIVKISRLITSHKTEGKSTHKLLGTGNFIFRNRHVCVSPVDQREN